MKRVEIIKNEILWRFRHNMYSNNKISNLVKYQLSWFGILPNKIEWKLEHNVNHITYKLKGIRNA